MADHPSSSKSIYATCSNNTNDGGNQTIKNELINTKIVHNHYPVPSQTTHSSSQVSFEPIDYVGGKVSSNIDVVLHRLRDKEFHPIAVWGMGGVGKTMLLTVVFNKLVKEPHIAGSAYWVSVSQNCSLYLLQEKIARAICLNFDGEEAVYTRAALLRHKFIEMGRVVLILDDVWDCFSADEIGIPCRESVCKMIFSTRRRALCKSMGYDYYTVNVRPLEKDEASKLFCSILKNYDELSAEIQEIALLVAAECHCVPLAIKVIAASLIGEYEIYAWRFALHKLKNLDIRHEEMEDKVHEVLRISYDRLKGDDLKNCFLNCALYPEDHVISRKELIELLIMDGSLDYLKERDMQLYRGHSIVDELVNSCLLEQCPRRSEYKVKMHDLIREMAVKIVGQEDPRLLVKSGLRLNRIPENDWNEGLVKASLSYNRIKEIPCGMSPHTPILTVLLLNNSDLLGIPDSFLVHMKSLRVLDLSFTKIQRLPDCVSDLEDLRMLLLRGCFKLKYVPSLAKLSKLRVLVLPFPEKVMWDLEELPRGMERLKSLEKLDYCQWKISDVNQFNTFIESAQSLTHYTLVLGDETFMLEEFFDRNFCIIGGNDKMIPKIPPTTELVSVRYLELERADNLVDGLPSLADLMQLKYLAVESCQDLEYIAIQSQYSSIFHLETLEKLSLDHLFSLERIIKYGANCFSHLKELIIYECPSLEVGLPIKSAHDTVPLLPNLERIQVCFCCEVKEIFETEDISSSHGIDGYNFDPIVALPKLRFIYLRNLPKLGSIYRGLLLCTSLKDKQVIECPKLFLLPLSDALICSGWEQSRASIPELEDKPGWWDPLLNGYSDDARKLLSFKAFGLYDNFELSKSVIPSCLDSLEGISAGDDSKMHLRKSGKYSPGKIFRKLLKFTLCGQ